MPRYSVLAEVKVTRAYEVEAIDLDEAKALFNDDYTLMSYDVMEEELESADFEEVD